MIPAVYFISRTIFWISLVTLCRIKITGKENFPESGAFIVASNHTSFADPPVMGVACSRAPLVFMAKKELFEVPVFGLWFKAMGCIPVDRRSGSFRPLKNALQKLKNGKPLGIFPEGTRSADGKLKKAELGIGFLAAKSKAPIIPMYISGTDKVLPKGHKFIKPHKVIVKIGKRLEIGDNAALSGDKDKIYASIGETVMRAIESLKNA
ncbi:MAG: 1-acyl-sn-glycerol-3-phosphate acyltransferase [Candidatus Omnitrophica bacterium]|nr:1-acyl-sn-glycerol-3-phosphate acyltransferase [Candidatus Omnitrophota bacterium]